MFLLIALVYVNVMPSLLYNYIHTITILYPLHSKTILIQCQKQKHIQSLLLLKPVLLKVKAKTYLYDKIIIEIHVNCERNVVNK